VLFKVSFLYSLKSNIQHALPEQVEQLLRFAVMQALDDFRIMLVFIAVTSVAINLP
jgi:hypothetical protein